MTHSNHRRGSRESLEEDYVILVRGDLKEKENEARKAVEILTENNPVGIVKRRKGKPSRKIKRKYRYVPSLAGIVGKVTIPKLPRVGRITGLELRPMIKRRKR